MEESKKTPCRKKKYEKVGFELKLFIINQIHNGQISINHAAQKYDVSRSSIFYWIKKYSTLEQINTGMA
ncbi:helix-turn-helix domain-containing protein [Croceivirga sp. JEA036]|uniref:helix-turn-helix domain-containing protein n=1 Tax=Croceivirga sp. JEA036 TaxID=2721162 RepID=UPI00143A5378|nr:helix-turn-helix domain-containing protein [Croceivirga sp. JEA036]NJB37790.1 transposase [Croceivirga sp. JEA036]